jgi:two-component system, cell cycle response regulator DivK
MAEGQGAGVGRTRRTAGGDIWPRDDLKTRSLPIAAMAAGRGRKNFFCLAATTSNATVGRPSALVYDATTPGRTQVTESGAARKRDDDPAKSFPPSRWHQAPLPHKRPQPRARRAGLVLIADDTRDSRELYGLYLSHQGFAVELASDGAAAVDAAIKLRPDVIVMDLSMPQLDGIAATIRLKAHPRTQSIPVILLTGYPYKAIAGGALEGGVDVFLTKPCLPEDLEAHVRRLLEGKGST